MFFDARAALRKLNFEEDPVATLATLATQKGKDALRVAEVASVATRRGQKTERSEQAPPEGPKSRSVGERPKTWTGKVVSLDDWQNLTSCEKHGPNGRVWCGVRKAWCKTGVAE